MVILEAPQLIFWLNNFIIIKLPSLSMFIQSKKSIYNYHYIPLDIFKLANWNFYACNILDSLNLELVRMLNYRTFFVCDCSTTVTCWKKSWILFRVSRDHLSIQSMKLQQRESRRLQRLFHHFMFSFSFSFFFFFLV